jgi:hypothetical protein
MFPMPPTMSNGARGGGLIGRFVEQVGEPVIS